MVIAGERCDGKGFPVTTKENDEIGHPAMIDVRIGVTHNPAPLSRIGGEVTLHVFVDFFLEIDADAAVRANDLVGTNTCVGGHIAAGVSDANISRIVANGVVCSLDS